MNDMPAGRYADGYVIDVPYLPGFYSFLAPCCLNGVAAFNGVAPVPTGGPFSYLELGCGFGDTLLTLAAANPQGIFTGVDINPVHARAMRERVDRCGLTNVRVCESGFDALPADLPRQQFITMHGVFSWVAEGVRARILAIARDLLAPGGLLLVSYNALPGWAPLMPVRQLIRELAEAADGDSCRRVEAALAAAREIQAAGAPVFAANPQAAQLLTDFAVHDSAYLAHEFLNDNWTAFPFAEVAARFAAAGLEYVGSLPLENNLPAVWPGPALARFLPAADRIGAEARADMLMNQSFRWDVYSSRPRRLVDAADRLAATGGWGVRLAEPQLSLPWKVTLSGQEITVDGPPHDRIVGLLGPHSLALAEFVGRLRTAGNAPGPGDILDALDGLIALGVLKIDQEPLPDSKPPAAGPLEVPDPFNRDILARLDPSVKQVTLASRRTGTGHGLRVLPALVLAEIAAEGSGPGSDAFIRAVDARLVSRGPPLAVRSTGRPITDPAERLEAIRAVCKDFMRIALPELVQLGIVAPR